MKKFHTPGLCARSSAQMGEEMGKRCKRWISYLLAVIMVFSMVPGMTAAAAEKGANLVPNMEPGGQVTFYYQGNGTEQEVYVKGSWDTAWSKYFFMTKAENDFWSVTTTELDASKSYEYGIVVDGNWLSPQPGGKADGGNPRIIRNPGINADGTVTFYYYPSGGENAADIKIEYTEQGGAAGEAAFAADASYPSLFSATTGKLSGTYTYKLLVSGQEVPDHGSSTNTFTVSAAPSPDPAKLSPVVEDDKVTFYYYNPTAHEVKLAGSMTNWGDGAQAMTYDGATGYWSIALDSQKSGSYQYKFVVDGNWMTDPLNSNIADTNSTYTVVNGWVPDAVSPAVALREVTFYYKGAATDSVVIPGSMNEWKTDGDGAWRMTDYDAVTGLWSYTAILSPGTYTYKYIVNGSWINDPANDQGLNSGNNQFTVQELPAGYHTYQIYYYDTRHAGTKDAALWLWEDGGSAGGREYRFQQSEKLDGFSWLKAEVDLPFTALGIIPKSYSPDSSNPVWSWQDAERKQTFAGDKTETIYLINGDTAVYTQKPDMSQIETPQDRYVLIEYQRDNGDYDGWNIYTWNSGFGSEVTVPFEQVNGKWTAKVPVSPATVNLSFCIRRSEAGNPWAEKDGGDHSVKAPAEQTVVKAKFHQGKGVTETLPYNAGYEIDTAGGRVLFYYRDNGRFLTDTQKELVGKVQVCIDAPAVRTITDGNASHTFDMTYDEKTERFVYSYGNLTDGEHTYYYLVDGEKKTDAYNDRTDAGGTASLFEYHSFKAKVTARMQNDTAMDYNDNKVLSISMEPVDGADITGLKVAEAYADTTQLGGGKLAVDPELMAVTVSVKDTVTPGTRQIPVTVKDQYGNTYSGQTAVEVKAREAGDFDWDEAVIYFAVTDRFYDGNTANNDAYGLGDYNKEEGGSSSYHGGDFAGLTEKLNYLQELGVNTVWITPVVENYMADGLATDDPAVKSYGYHGYWASDFEKLNKHLGTEAELSTLVQELHKRGMKLMVDVVLNHAGYNTDGSNITDYFDSRLPGGKKMLRDSSNTVAGSEVQASLAGLLDFVTEDKEVRELLIEWQTAWVSRYDIDYFRVDTVKHVEDTTWAAFKNALTIVNPDFKMIGEQSGAGYATSAGKLRTGEMDSLLDFDFNDKALDFVSGKVSEVESFLEQRSVGIDNTATMGSFLSSHDEDGLMYRMQKEMGMSSEDSYNAMKVAAALQITAKGQPVIYYGEELGQTGANNYPYQTNRYDFDWSLVKEDNTMLSHYRTLLDIREEYSDLFAKGDRTGVLTSDEKGLNVFARSYGEEKLYVALQVGKEARQVALSMGKAGDTVQDLYSGSEYTVGEDGKVEITVPASQDGGTAILKLESKTAENKPDEEKPDETPNETPSGETSGGGQQSSGGQDNGSQKNTGADTSVKENKTTAPAAVTPVKKKQARANASSKTALTVKDDKAGQESKEKTPEKTEEKDKPADTQEKAAGQESGKGTTDKPAAQKPAGSGSSLEAAGTAGLGTVPIILICVFAAAAVAAGGAAAVVQAKRRGRTGQDE